MPTEQLTHDTHVLKRLAELYGEQYECFCSYLDILEKQESLIVSDSEEGILASIEHEEQLLADIFSIRKVIDPLEALYSGEITAVYADDLMALKTKLESLNNQVKAQLQRNRELLAQRMENTQAQIRLLRNNPLSVSARHSRFLNTVSPSMIDIRG